MVHPKINETLSKYVKLINGLDNFGFRDSFLNLEKSILFVDTKTGDITFKSDNFVNAWDCGRVAYRIGKEFDKDGFDVKYKVSKSNYSYQNFIEVYDKESSVWVQVDPTPWYECINPGHKDSFEHDNIDDLNYKILTLEKDSGLLLSVNKYSDDSFFETYLSGYFNGNYNLRLQAIHLKSAKSLPDRVIDLNLEVLDIKGLIEKGMSDDYDFIKASSLDNNQSVKVSIVDYGKNNLISVELYYQHLIMKKLTNEIRQNIPVINNILKYIVNNSNV